MKRFTLIVLSILLLASPLSSRTLGYSLALDGEKTGNNGFSGASLALSWQPFEWKWMNPSLTLSSSFATDMNGTFMVPSLTLHLDFDLFRALRHPFTLIAHNRIAYDPSVGVGLQVRFDDSVRPALFLNVSPFKFSQPDFWYEALSPFATYSNEDWSWGVALFRFTFLCL